MYVYIYISYYVYRYICNYITLHNHFDSDGWCHKPGTLPAKSLHPQGIEWPLGHPRRKLASESRPGQTWTDLDRPGQPVSLSFLKSLSCSPPDATGCPFVEASSKPAPSIDCRTAFKDIDKNRSQFLQAFPHHG